MPSVLFAHYILPCRSSALSRREAFRWVDPDGNGEVNPGEELDSHPEFALGDLPGGGDPSSRVNALSADGSIAVGFGTTDLGQEAFIWGANKGMRNLHTVLHDGLGYDLTGWTLASPEDISDNGQTIVGTGNNPGGNTEAWIARPGRFWDTTISGD